MSWNPEEHKPEKAQNDGGDRDERVIPSGDYILGITWWKRVSERAIKVRVEVLAGPMKGASCFPMISTNVTEKKGSADRMFHICKAFHITGDLNFDEQCFSTQFVGKAGKAKLNKSKNGQWTNHDIARTFHRPECSEAERSRMVEWQEEYASRSNANGPAGTGGWEASDDGFENQDFGADDIPF